MKIVWPAQQQNSACTTRLGCNASPFCALRQYCWKIAIFATEIILRKVMFTVSMQCLPSYLKAFEENVFPRFLNARIMDIADDMKSHNFLFVNSNATHVRCITFGMMMIKHKCVPPLLLNLVRDRPADWTLVIMHLHDSYRSISSQENIPSWFKLLRRSSISITSLASSTKKLSAIIQKHSLTNFTFIIWRKTKTRKGGTRMRSFRNKTDRSPIQEDRITDK